MMKLAFQQVRQPIKKKKKSKLYFKQNRSNMIECWWGVREERAYAGLEAAFWQREGPTLGYSLACPRTERTVCWYTESKDDES